MQPLADQLQPCGPVLDPAAAERALEVLSAAAERDGWSGRLAQAVPALAPVFAASPYLAGLARGRPAMLAQILADPPDQRLEAILAEPQRLETAPTESDDVSRRLRELKAETHLLTALADLSGVWDLDAVTAALTRFADAALRCALAEAARAEIARGRLLPPSDPARGPIPGLFCIAMGKYGAFELNYSSDIDFSVFFDPAALPLGQGVEPQAEANRLTQAVAELLQARTHHGYVFRVDLRLRPDPSSTPIAAPVAAALDYYESVGQNWERCAYIKARVAAGDLRAGEAFLRDLLPFVWRRNLDFAAIADIHSIKRQIHVHKVDERMTAKGADLKLGHGGIREIEFYAQTQQLILGGRDPRLRSPRTQEALAALAEAGHVEPRTAAELSEAYDRLRALEHRAQMVGDHQTHKLPESDAERRRIAALAGEGDLRRFDAGVGRLLRAVNARYGELFADDEDLSSRFGSLVFTGVEDDPETLKTLHRMGFSEPAKVAATIRAWHHGRISATRTERGRELFTRLAPRLLEAAQATGAADAAFARFAEFFAGLSSGVQVQSLFLAQPKLFELVVEVMAIAPRLATILARRPVALDALMDPNFFQPIDPGEHRAALAAAMARLGPGFEAAMDAARQVHREQAFRIGVQVMSGAAHATEAGAAFADLADACIQALAPAALAETHRMGGDFPGEVAVVALGRCGSREMNAGSDLDLMTVYRAEDPAAMSTLKSWGAETVYARFTQRLIAALSSPTAEGTLYQVDMRLRPSGTAGPVAVSLRALIDYYAGEAETWEFLALTRARVAWASSPAFAETVAAALDQALRRPREPARTAAEVLDMRALMARERPDKGFWDLKLSPGGLVDIEFAAQYLQIVHAGESGPLRPHTGEALTALAAAGIGEAEALAALGEAWSLQQDLSQVLKVALEDQIDPSHEPKALRRLLARAGGVRDFPALVRRLKAAKLKARTAFEAVVR
ncbi:bifunctional [glutamine synthetase] adenylyltransferase/[glutamine synthetase]-adenylyl-L-tyrosine phosphorylase [Phenylobacterium montanum]|uniref:Bifunctional glutamine synthetase adenylyltransferase/adenylyl-removing enzyme n=1 Tax=Phenylobacterium montanum TaxID=2823693 RepID=A0A975ISW7_9CAUL|nr:bifunctional [glutamine synthetase] adenylyltransferase/[glutamine synthetase]-adenylyl-L-tyrosine phosphorylase [Caulobacter sp. S6]QUD86115.1 bifunctional [glutamine synthetase] adenylyltransferase/[glutamine synthetase]-adenylyl-L-tyrosine phosphorylase [Caulobacter sp. S6]